MQTVTEKLGEVDCRPDLQPRVEGLDASHVRELEVIAGAWPPLKVVRQGNRFVLVDGFHRYAAAQNLGLATVAVEVLEPPPDGDLISLAFALNAAHGKPLTLSDRRAFAARLLRQHADLSDREIGRRAGLVQPTIAKVRYELEQQATIQPAETRKGRDGRSYPAKPEPARKTPLAAAFNSIAATVERLTTPAERLAQRDAARFLKRLAEVFGEGGRIDDLATTDSAVSACRLVLGDESAAELGVRLVTPARAVVAIAEALSAQRTEQAAP